MNHYQNLGVSTNATEAEIKKAYRTLAKKYHPDRNKSDDAATRFISINRSYELLLNGQGYTNLNTHTYYTKAEEPKKNPVNEFDLDGDGKLSREEWKRMKNHEFEEAARAFYNLHQTSWGYRLHLSKFYFLIFGIAFLSLFFGMLFCLLLYYNPDMENGIEKTLAIVMIMITFSIPLISIITGKWSIRSHKVYLKIIRKKYDPKFKILGLFWF